MLLLIEMAASAAWENEIVPLPANKSSPRSPLQHTNGGNSNGDRSGAKRRTPTGARSRDRDRPSAIDELNGSTGKRAQDLRAVPRSRSFQSDRGGRLEHVLRLGLDKDS